MSSKSFISPPKSIAIIGAGLGGLTLALSLQKKGIQPELFELRTPDYDFGGAIMLSPNALRVLDSLDVYERVRGKGYNFDTLTFKNDQDLETTGKYYFGQKEMYGYQALRIYRSTLLKELRAIVKERGISIEYGKKFSHVISEGESGVHFAFADGEEKATEFPVGADGIHSTVRRHLLPDVVPTYVGFIGVTYAFSKSKLRLPNEEFELPVSIHGKSGAFIMAPQNPDGQEIFVGRQFKYPLQDRDGWAALLKEKTDLIEMHQNDMNEWSDVVRSGQEQASSPDSHSFNVWPFHTVPKLEKWASNTGRIIIVGDAAHAIPPTAGQGANQAFEDAYSLAFLLSSLSTKAKSLEASLKLWQVYRQERVDQVLVVTDQMSNIRLSEEEKRSLPMEKIWRDEGHGSGDGQLGWLYLHRIEDQLLSILGDASQTS